MFKLITLAVSAALVGIDQLIKARVVGNIALVSGQAIEVVPGLFYLSYVENRGAAFGIMQNMTGLLSVVTSVVLMALVWYVASGRCKGRFLTCCIALIVAGGTGNLIDRIWRGFVVDYLDFSALFGFPVFNFADCCVVVGTLLLLIGILWSDRREAGVPPADKTVETEE